MLNLLEKHSNVRVMRGTIEFKLACQFGIKRRLRTGFKENILYVENIMHIRLLSMLFWGYDSFYIFF